MKIAFSTLGCPAWSLDQIAEFAGKHGFDGVELRTCSDGNHMSDQASIEEATRIGELFRSKGTRVFSLMAYTSFTSEKKGDLERNQQILLHVLDLAKAAGADFVRTFVGGFQGRRRAIKRLRTLPEYLAPCAAKGRRLGVSLGVETHDDWCDASNIRALQKAVGGGLGAVWDFVNAVHATGRNVNEQFADLKGTILYCHVKDGVGAKEGKFQYVPVGTGEMPVREAVEILKKNGLDLYLSFEHEKKWIPELPDPEVAFPEYIRFMRSIV